MTTSANGTETQAANGSAQTREGNQAMEEVLYHVKSNIDLEGRYLERLKVVSIGFAAGRGISPVAARTQIEKGFTEKFGQSPHEYLEQHFQVARSNGNRRENFRQQSAGMKS
jgi:hypothetical protein